MTHGMVSAPQPEAVEAGIDILAAGGNAIDAAIGAAFVQTVVDPQMCGIAGFGSCHVVLAGGTHKIIDFHGRAPKAVTPEMWENLIVRECDDGFGFVLKGEVNEIGYQSMTTPMTLKAFDEILGKWGTQSLEDIMQPAIQYCEQGFQVRPSVHNFWTRPAEAGRIARERGQTKYPATAKIYTGADGKIHKIGDLLRNPDMGRTYRRIA
ncbi:MAG: gamma-glutamyltransferase, partial [Pseudomonadota bacterium]